MHYLEKINFTTSFGDQVTFDENGDALPIYDVINWVWLPDGSAEVKNVGVFKKSASGYENLILDEDRIFWSFESKKVTFFSKITNVELVIPFTDESVVLTNGFYSQQC